MALTKVTGQIVLPTTDLTVGVLTVTNTLAVGGTVSVGGTLTYEDVTNVDAVGLITARNGINVIGAGVTIRAGGLNVTSGVSTFSANVKVGTGITLSVDGDVYATGVVTATSYNGPAGVVNFNGTDFGFNTTPGGTPASKAVFLAIGDSDTGIVQDGDGQLELWANATEIANLNSVDGYSSTKPITTTGAISGSTGTFSGDVDIADKIVHTGDTNTAIRFPTADTITAETGGSERLRIDSSGRLLVGATARRNINNQNANAAGDSVTPYFYAEGTGDSKALTLVSNNTNAWRGSVLGLARTRGTSVGDSTIVADDDNIGQIVFAAGDGTDLLSNAATIRADIDATPGANDTPGRLVFSTTADGAVVSTERMRITCEGRLLVGATAATNSSIAEFSKSVSGGAAGCHITVANTSTDSVNNTAGIHLKTDQGVAKFFTFRASETYLQSRAGGTSDLLLVADGSSKMVFKTNGSERLRIASDGIVSITGGTVSRAFKVNSTHTAGGEIACFDNGVNNHYGALLVSAGEIDRECRLEAAYGNSLMTFWTQDASAAGERMRIDKDGNVLVGTATPNTTSATAGVYLAPHGTIVVRRNGNMSYWKTLDTGGYNSHVFLSANTTVGTIVISSGGTAYNTSSDYRLKENVSGITDGITRVKQLKPSKFNWIADDTNTPVDGFLAHEVSSLVPEAITGTKDGVAVEDDDETGTKKDDPVYQQIDQSKLVPLLTAALQEEIAKREALESRVAALESA